MKKKTVPRASINLTKLKSHVPLLMFFMVLVVAILSIYISTNRRSSNVNPILESLQNTRNKTTLEKLLANLNERDYSSDTIIAQDQGGTGESAQECKLGVNLLVGPVLSDEYARATNIPMGYYLHVLQGGQFANLMSQAINSTDMTAIVRFCDADDENGEQDPDCEIKVANTGNSCASGRAAAAVINNIASGTNKSFIAAPVNEPNAEHWFGRTGENLAQFYRCFAQDVRNGAFANQVTIASPTWNVNAADGSFQNLLSGFLGANGDQYIDMWSFNFYQDVPGQEGMTIESTINNLKSIIPDDDKPWGINETGDYNGDLDQRFLDNMGAIAEDDNITYALLFNAFGQDTGNRWPQLELSDDQIRTILRAMQQAGCEVPDDPTPTSPAGNQFIDPETAEYLETPGHWPIQSCEVRQNPNTTNGIGSSQGELSTWLVVNPCNDQRNTSDRPYGLSGGACPVGNGQNELHWTAGYVHTGGMRRFPLVEYLASAKATDNNEFTTWCQSLSFRNVTDARLYFKEDRTKGPFQLYFTSEFPGLGRFINNNNSVNIKVPLLGGASACGIVNFNEVLPDSNDTQIMRLHPLSLTPIKHSGGEIAGTDTANDSFWSRLITLIREKIFSKPAIPNNENQPAGIFCPDIPGEPIRKFHTKDTRAMQFVDDNPQGPYEYVVKQKNVVLNQNDLCKANFQGAQSITGNSTLYVKDIDNPNEIESVEVEGASCRFNETNGVFLRKGGTGDPEFVQWVVNPQTGVRTCPNTVNICGLQVSCDTSHEEIFNACIGQHDVQEVRPVGDEILMRWRRHGYEQIELIGLARALYNTWYLERISSPFKIIHRANVGLRTEWGTRVYDVQLPKQSAKELSGALREAVDGYNQAMKTDPGADFDPDDVATGHPLGDYVSYLDQPGYYRPVHVGGYELARTTKGPAGEDVGVTKADMNYYVPWLGQIPRIWERISVFLENTETIDTGLPFNPNQCLAAADLENTALADLQLDFCDCPCINGEDDCDCFARNETAVDPLEEWLFAPRSSTDISGGGFGNNPFDVNIEGADAICQEVLDPEPTPTPGPVDEECNPDSVVNGHASPTDSTLNNNSGAHVGLDTGGDAVYNIGQGRVLWVRNTSISDSLYENGCVPGSDGCEKCGDSCDWKSLSTVGGFGWKEYGNVIAIEHEDAISIYAHLANDSIDASIVPGACIPRNRQIARVGNTGNSTGKHLHFELRKQNCTAYTQSCVYNNNDTSRHRADLSTPRGETYDPIPATGNPPGTTTVEQCYDIAQRNPKAYPYTPPAEGSEKNIECLAIKTANFLNDQYQDPAFNNQAIPRIPWQMIWAIGYKETYNRCTGLDDDTNFVSHVLWRKSNNPTSYTSPQGVKGRKLQKIGDPDIYLYSDTCTGNPNEVGMHYDGNEVAPKVRGVTQFGASTFDSIILDTYWEDVFFGSESQRQAANSNMPSFESMVARYMPEFASVNWSNYGAGEGESDTGDLLEACVSALGVINRPESKEARFDPNGILSTADPDRFSRARVGDSLCATAIMLSEIAAAFNNGEYVAPEDWDELTVAAAAAPYHGNCSLGYCSRTIDLYNFAINNFDASDPNFCEGEPSSPTNPSPENTTGQACPLPGSRASQWTDGGSHSLCEYRSAYPNNYVAVDLPGDNSSRAIAPVDGTLTVVTPWDNPYRFCQGDGSVESNYDGGYVHQVTDSSGKLYRLVHTEPLANDSTFGIEDKDPGTPGIQVEAGQQVAKLYDGIVNESAPGGGNYNATGRGCWGRQHIHFNIQNGGNAQEFVTANCPAAGQPFDQSGWDTAPNTCCTSRNSCNQNY